MTIEQRGVIDIIATDAAGEVANLIACDHIEWNSEELNEHLVMIQEKINEYLSFIESGNLFEVRPELRQMRLVLKVVGKYGPPPEAVQFYDAMQKVLAQNGYPFVFEHAPVPPEGSDTESLSTSNVDLTSLDGASADNHGPSG